MCGHSWDIDYNSDWARLETVLHRLKTLLIYTEKVNNSQLIRLLLTGDQKPAQNENFTCKQSISP